MAQTNTKSEVKGKGTVATAATYEGAPAIETSNEQALRRAVMSCFLWENNFYEGGVEISDRIRELVPKVHPEKVAHIAREGRNQFKIRHAPLWVARVMLDHDTHRPYVEDLLVSIINRPDELSEFLAQYWADGKKKIPARVKKGLARAFTKFDGYQLAKYNRNKDIKLTDIMYLTHPKPLDAKQAEVFHKLADGNLESPDTWEVAQANIKSRMNREDRDKVDYLQEQSKAWRESTDIWPIKKEKIKDLQSEIQQIKAPYRAKEWERLLDEDRLGVMALLRNLRNMVQVGVDDQKIRDALNNTNLGPTLPIRAIAALNHAPQFHKEINDLLMREFKNKTKLPGNTVILVDVSGSMTFGASSKSEMRGLEFACSLAVIANELCENARVVAFSDYVKEVPAYEGLALYDTLKGLKNGGTMLGVAVNYVNDMKPDRIITITDEQAHDRVSAPYGKGYMINVMPYNKSVDLRGDWHKIAGRSDAAIEFVKMIEEEKLS